MKILSFLPKPLRRLIGQSLVAFGIDGCGNHDVPQKAKVIWIGLAGENPRVRAKVRAKHVLLALGWSSAVLRSIV